MDLQDQLLESSDRKQKGVGKYSIASILFLSTTATHKVDAEQPIHAFFATKAAPPPPPPPPPPPASSAPTPPHISTPKPVVVHQQSFVQPTETPKIIPKVEPVTTTKVEDLTPSQPSTDTAPSGGEAGGVAGGVTGGVAGGVQGGVVGGVQGGVVGGTLGGVLGGKVGGTGTGTGDGNGTADVKPVEPPKDEGPLRVGGDVKAPTVTKRVEPTYSEMADSLLNIMVVGTRSRDRGSHRQERQRRPGKGHQRSPDGIV